jgi:hypothetical protein
MKYLCGLLLLAAGAMAEDLDTYLDAEADPRLFIANFTSSLIQVNATILAYALIAVAVVGAVLVGLSFLFVETANTSDSSYGSYGNQYAYGQYAR